MIKSVEVWIDESDNSYEVFAVNHRDIGEQVAYGDKHTDAKDNA